MIEFRVLGEIELWVGQRRIPIRGARQQGILTALLIEANRPVTNDQLLERAWGTHPWPTRPRATLRTQLTLLRRALAPADGVTITWQPTGYRLTVDTDHVDVHRFHRLIRKARTAPDDERAAELLERALALWRGEAFASLDTPWLAAQRGTLEREQHAAQLDLIDARLRRDQHTMVLTDLADLATAHPWDERVAGQLMLALYRGGRRADALAHYQQLRQRFADQLGTDPSPPLQHLHHQILTADPSLTPSTKPASTKPAPTTTTPTGTISTETPPAETTATGTRAAKTTATKTTPAGTTATGPTASGPTAPGTISITTPVRAGTVPRQLPAPPRTFVGRNRELTALAAALGEQPEAGRQPVATTMVITTIGGMGGVGKTALALHWAHRHAEDFPDGQLFVDLRGFTPTAPPASPEEALPGFLAALGADPRSIPTDLAAQAALYRSLVANKRMLVLLDNARDSAQVTPLLPGSPTCTVLITSRQRLTDLVASGAHQLDLDVLADADARDLLTRFAGRARVAIEPAAATDLLLTCAGLPLAISIVGARASTHPDFPLSALAAELHDTHAAEAHDMRNGASVESSSPSMADADEVTSNLDAVFASSYRTLDPDASALFGLLALAPGPDISTPAAANLAALPMARARTLLRTLEDAHFLQQHWPGRYRTHDLIRRYATYTAHHHLDPEAREAGLRRVVDFYLHTARDADHLLYPHRLPIQLDPPAPGVHPHPLADVPAALAWFDSEHDVLLAALHTVVRRGWHTTVWQLAWALDTFHVSRGNRHDRLAVSLAALDAAAHLTDPTALVLAHRRLGDVCTDLGRYEEAMEHLHQALALAEDQHDTDQQARTHRVLAWSWEQRGDNRKALEHATHALELWRTFDYPVKQAEILNDVGWYAARLGEYDTARTHCQAALALARDHHDHRGEASILGSLGYIDHQVGQHQHAIHHYHQALALFRDTGDAYHVADTLDRLGHPHLALGDRERARTAWQEALALYEEQGRDTHADRVHHQLAGLDHHAATTDAHT